MGKYRKDRVNDAVVKEMGEIMREVQDPRIASSMVTITAAQVSPDLKYAKLYFSSLAGDKKEIRTALKSAAGFIRGRLAARMNLRNTPELVFEEDRSIEHGANIASILKSIQISKPDTDYDEETKQDEEV